MSIVALIFSNSLVKPDFSGEPILYSLDGHIWTVFQIMNCLEMAFGKGRHLNTVLDLQLYSYIIALCEIKVIKSALLVWGEK